MNWIKLSLGGNGDEPLKSQFVDQLNYVWKIRFQLV
jgi:hypothetical protein